MLRLEVKPNVWSCLATSMAMALEITTPEFYEWAHHDGGEVVFPWMLDPQCRKGFHIQEAIHVARQLGFACTPFELFPQTRAAECPNPMLYDKYQSQAGEVIQIRYENHAHLHHNWDLFTYLITHGRGVIECQTRKGNWHAVAYDQGHIFNPDGEAYPYSRENCEVRGLHTRCLWQVTKC